MVITVNGAPITIDWDTLLIWVLVGLVAGFFASHLALGHGLGLFGDIIVGILGAVVGGFLAAIFHFSIVVVGHPIVSAMIIAFIVGGPIPIAEALRGGGFPAGIAALGFSVAGALVGAYIGVVVRRSAASSSA